MRRLLAVLLLALALIAASCGDDDDATSTGSDAADDAGDDDAGAADAGEEDAGEGDVEDPEPTVDETIESDMGQETEGNPPASGDDGTAEAIGDDSTDIGIDASGFTASIDDPVYVDLILDCWYGENEAGSCEQLEAAGLSADDAYGLGNSYAQAPPVFLREDCLNGDGIACAELNAAVQLTAQGGGASDPSLMCLFYSVVFDGVAVPDLDLFHLTTLMGPDAPPGVQDALTVLASDPGNADAMASLDGYLGPICAGFME